MKTKEAPARRPGGRETQDVRVQTVSILHPPDTPLTHADRLGHATSSRATSAPAGAAPTLRTRQTPPTLADHVPCISHYVCVRVPIDTRQTAPRTKAYEATKAPPGAISISRSRARFTYRAQHAIRAALHMPDASERLLWGS
eukprot:7390891-Prymnesium_polylepis.1